MEIAFTFTCAYYSYWILYSVFENALCLVRENIVLLVVVCTLKKYDCLWNKKRNTYLKIDYNLDRNVYDMSSKLRYYNENIHTKNNVSMEYVKLCWLFESEIIGHLKIIKNNQSDQEINPFFVYIYWTQL